MESFTREAGRCNENHLVRVYRCSQFRNHTAKGEGFQICLAGYFDASRLGVPGVDCQWVVVFFGMRGICDCDCLTSGRRQYADEF